MFLKAVRSWLEEPEVRNLDPDSPDRVAVHRAIFLRKPLTLHVFQDIHREMKRQEEAHFGNVEGLRLELGAGSSPMRDMYPEVIATDVIATPGIDRVIDGENMDLPDASVRAIFGKGFFHHLPHPERFLQELARVVKPGGGAVLVEPGDGPFAEFLYKRIFTSEGFDKSVAQWSSAGAGIMSGANQALSYIVFKRDVERFRAKFPQLRLVAIRPLSSWLRYIVSGGVNFRPLLPAWTEFGLKGVERLLRPWAHLLGTQQIIVLQRLK
jgi:SAM-dependent methyltransferase